MLISEFKVFHRSIHENLPLWWKTHHVGLHIRYFQVRKVSKHPVCFKVPMHRNACKFFIGWYEGLLKTKKKAFYCLLISSSIPEI